MNFEHFKTGEQAGSSETKRLEFLYQRNSSNDQKLSKSDDSDRFEATDRLSLSDYLPSRKCIERCARALACATALMWMVSQIESVGADSNAEQQDAAHKNYSIRDIHSHWTQTCGIALSFGGTALAGFFYDSSNHRELVSNLSITMGLAGGVLMGFNPMLWDSPYRDCSVAFSVILSGIGYCLGFEAGRELRRDINGIRAINRPNE